MYNLISFGDMLADEARFNAYAESLRRLVRPTSVVADIGAGTGIWSLLAARLGARKVYAIEPSPAVQILAQAARDNDLAERIVVLQKRSTDVTLPERADLIVSDLRGVLPPFQTHFADIVDARERLLAPGGRLVPESDTMMAAVISAPEAFERARRPWQDVPYGLDLRAALPFVENASMKVRARADELLTAPLPWARLHYPTLDVGGVRGAVTYTCTQAGTAHGLLVWFDAELVAGVGYSNAPGSPEGIYGQILFPWPEAVAVRAGDEVAVELRADPIGSDIIWTWATEIVRHADPANPPRRFRQSTFKSTPISPESLLRRAPTFAPGLSADGELAVRVLEELRVGRTVGTIANGLREAHPERFRAADDALGFVVGLSDRYGA